MNLLKVLKYFYKWILSVTFFTSIFFIIVAAGSGSGRFFTADGVVLAVKLALLLMLFSLFIIVAGISIIYFYGTRVKKQSLDEVIKYIQEGLDHFDFWY